MEPITCAYGSEVKVYESSAASGPHIWLNVQTDVGVLTQQKPGEGTAHLTLEQAELLRDQLSHLISHHYQTEGDNTMGAYKLTLTNSLNDGGEEGLLLLMIVAANSDEEAQETALNYKDGENTIRDDGWRVTNSLCIHDLPTSLSEPAVMTIQRYSYE